MATHILIITRWRPTLLNEMKGHWARGHRLKSADAEIVAAHAKEQAIPIATSKRRVSLRFYLGKGQRKWDPDAPWKSCLDALKRCQLLVNDSPAWSEMGPVEFIRLKKKDTSEPRTEIVLEDLE